MVQTTDEIIMGKEIKQLEIVFFAHSAGMPAYGMVFGHYFLAREWVRMGHRVTIVAASYVHTRFRQPQQAGKVSEEYIDGVRYVWVPTPEYNPRSHIGRVRNIFSYSLRCWFSKLPITSADLVICSSPQPFAIFPARKYARKLNARLVFEVRDLWPTSLIELSGTSRLNPFILMTQKAEDYAYKRAHRVVTVLSHAKDYMVSRGMAPEKFVYVPNGISLHEETEKQALPGKHQQQLLEFRNKGLFIVGYAGKMGLSNALHILLDALALANGSDIAVALLGGGAYTDELKEQAKKLNITEKVLFLEPVAKSQVFDFLDNVDAAYIGLQNKSVFRFGVSPTKLNDFMLAARPIIYAIDEPGKVAEESGACIRCTPDSTKALAEAIDKMRNIGNTEREAMGKRGHDWVVKNRNYQVLAKRFLDAAMSR